LRMPFGPTEENFKKTIQVYDLSLAKLSTYRYNIECVNICKYENIDK